MEETLESTGKDHKWGRMKGFCLAIVEPGLSRTLQGEIRRLHHSDKNQRLFLE